MLIGLVTSMVFNYIYREFYMSAHVLLNLLKELGKRDKMRVRALVLLNL